MNYYGLAYLKDPYKNDTERAYAQYLELLKRSGEVLRYDYEPERLRLGDGSFYKPDFRVVASDLVIEMHEVKGHWREAAKVRIKVAADLHPYRFKAVKKSGNGWMEESF